jgi:hypothetical protein
MTDGIGGLNCIAGAGREETGCAGAVGGAGFASATGFASTGFTAGFASAGFASAAGFAAGSSAGAAIPKSLASDDQLGFERAAGGVLARLRGSGVGVWGGGAGAGASGATSAPKSFARELQWLDFVGSFIP